MLAIDFYSLLHTLRSLDQSPEAIVQIWQSVITREPNVVLLVDSKPYWRTKVYPEYKGNRVSPPLEKELIDSGTSLGLPTLIKEGLEADDWAGLMAHYKRIKGIPGTLRFLTVDTDWMQLIDDEHGIEWENLGKHTPCLRRHQEAVTWAYTRHKIWIPHPRYIGNMKRILGDSCDNVPPRHPEPLTELMGDEWFGALERAGFVLSELLGEVEKVYQ